jgi:hypothetical protein
MSPDLTELLSATAALLDDAGPLQPVRLALAGRDVQLTFAEFTTTADQRASVDRLAAATSTDPVLSELGARAYTYTLTADLPGGVMLIAGTHPTLGRHQPARTTSTSATAALLRALVPWARTLSGLPVTGLEITDDAQRLAVQLLVDSAGDPDAAMSRAATGVTALRTCPADPFGIDGRGRLPSGHPVLISVM